MAAIREHHRRALAKLAERFSEDPRFPALIAGGSVAKGIAQDDSDVDVVFVASDEEWARRQPLRDYFLHIGDLCDYPNGYVDGKVVPLAFLEEVAERGSEPARFAFAGAFIAYSRIPGLAYLLRRIPVYQEAERAEKMASFYSQVLLLNWFVPEAEKRGDPYLLAQASTDLVLFGGRLLLAWNRRLFPSHKWFLAELEQAEEKPEGFLELARRVLDHPCAQTARAFCDSITGYRDWGVTFPQAVSRFIEDSEWNWRCGSPPLRDS